MNLILTKKANIKLTWLLPDSYSIVASQEEQSFFIPGITGPKGEQGDQGDRGDIGPSGPAGGDPGSDGGGGSPGQDGDDGATGPQGEKGEQGEQGEQGADGSGGGSTSVPAPVTDVSDEGLSGKTWTELTLLSGDIEAGNWYEFVVENGGVGYIMSDAILETTAVAVAPSAYTAGTVRAFYIGNDTDEGGWSHGKMWVAQSDEANKMWVRHGRATSITLTIRKFSR